MKKFLLSIIAVLIIIGLSWVGYNYHEQNNIKNHTLAELILKGTNKQIAQKISKGADVNEVKENITPLMLAAVAQRDAEVFRSLVDAGANVNYKGQDGVTPLMLSSGIQEPDAVKILIDAGADVNAVSKNGQTPLMFAAEVNSNPSVIDLLVDAGADINYKNSESKNAVTCAAISNDNIEVLKKLISRGAVVEDHVLMILVANQADVEALKVVIDTGVDVNYVDGNNFTPLVISILEAFSIDTVKLLIDSGADVNYVFKDGLTPLMITAKRPDQPMAMQLLLSSNIDIDDPQFDDIKASINQEQKTLESINLQIVELLLKAGADVNRKASDGSTALDFAKQTQTGTKVADALIKAGSNIKE